MEAFGDEELGDEVVVVDAIFEGDFDQAVVDVDGFDGRLLAERCGGLLWMAGVWDRQFSSGFCG